jgi:LPPG:FO 2-phospho-L-lactate transferase
MGVKARVRPIADEPIRTQIRARGRTLPFQEFMIVERAEGPIDSVDFTGAGEAAPTPEVLEALAEADAIVIGPSNPVASIGPMLAVPGLREALVGAAAPVVAVSPFVGGAVLKGPTLAFCAYAGIEPAARGLLEAYAGLLDGVVADEPVQAIAALELDTLMDASEGRRRVAEAALELAASLRR